MSGDDYRSVLLERKGISEDMDKIVGCQMDGSSLKRGQKFGMNEPKLFLVVSMTTKPRVTPGAQTVNAFRGIGKRIDLQHQDKRD